MIPFSRTPPGLSAEYLFYSEILVYVEGYTDIPFYNEVLQNYRCRIKSKNGKSECEKFATLIEQGNYPYVVVLDGDYEILEYSHSPHRRIVSLHRHSFENYLLEENPIEKFRHYRAPLEDSLDRLPSSFREIVEDTEQRFKELLILDVAHQRAETGFKVLPKSPDQFFAGPRTSDFLESRIQKKCIEATQCIDKQSIESARVLVQEFLKKHRFLTCFPVTLLLVS